MRYSVANVITGSGSQESAAQDEGASLTSVLDTPQLRIELTLLVLLCTDSMRADILSTFDPSRTHISEASAVSSPKPPASASQDLMSFDSPQENENLPASERARQTREREIQSENMQGLRRAALTFFDKWRAGVMHRICDVLCVRGEVVRSAKAKRKAAREAAEREKHGTSLLIDLGSDPFSNDPPPKRKQRFGHYDSIENNLTRFDQPKRVLILHCVLLLLLSLEHYPAHSRVLLLHLAGSLELEVGILAEREKSIAQGLLASAASQMDAEEAAKKKAAEGSAARKWKVGLAAVGGAVLIGVTGGLAAPLLAAGVGTVMGGIGLGATVVSGYLGALAGSSVLVGTLFGAYGGKMTGRIMDNYAKEVDDFEFIPVQDPNRLSNQRANEWGLPEEEDARDPSKREQHRLRVCIGVSGWLNSPLDVSKPWEVLNSSGIEPFALRFELDAMLRLGNSLNDVLFNYAWDGITYTVVSRTLLGALYAGLWPLGLLKAASVLDNPFSVAVARADRAGKVLAQALINKVQGERPVTLVGYSLGARVIYSCLVHLAQVNAFGLVESAVLMGAPAPSDTTEWRKIRSVVAARVVNVYSEDDYILGFLYRTSKLQKGVAGLQEVQDVYGIQNVNMTKLVSGHDRYRYLVGTILTKIGFEDINFEKVEEQSRALELMERKKEQSRRKAKERGGQDMKSCNDSASLDEKPPALPIRPAPSTLERRKVVFDREAEGEREKSATSSNSIEMKASFTEMKADGSLSKPLSRYQSPVSSSLRETPPPYSLTSTTDHPLMDSSDEESSRIFVRNSPSNEPPMSKGQTVTETVSVKQTTRSRAPPNIDVRAVVPEEELDTESEEEDMGELSMVAPEPIED